MAEDKGSGQTIIACVLKSGGDFHYDYVARLVDGIRNNLSSDMRIVCLSDVSVPCESVPLLFDWPGWWSKLELFRPDIEDDILYFDLDTVIVGDLTDIVSVKKLTMLSDFYVPQSPASGMMFIPNERKIEIWRAWTKEPEAIMKRCGRCGDQMFLKERWSEVDRWQDILPGQVISYKVHAINETPKDARVVCFHGKPRPHEVERFWH